MKVYAFYNEGFETVEALAVVDVLRRVAIEVINVSLTDSYDVKSAQRIVVKCDALWDEVKNKITTEDVLFLPGGPGTKYYLDRADFIHTLKVHHEANGLIAAICAAPTVLGRIGLLEGRRAICFPGCEDELYGAEILKAPVKVVTDGNIITARGMGAAVDLGLELIKILKSEEEAKRIGVLIQYLEEAEN